MKANVLTFVILLSSFAANSTVHVVTVRNFAYDPSTINAFVGDTVRFIWESGIHPTSSLDAEWPTFTISSSHTEHDIKMSNLGTFEYQCDSHVSGGMTGVITVDPLLGTKTGLSSKVKVYPNPAKERVSIDLADVIADEVQIVTMCGHIVHTEFISGSVRSFHTDLPLGRYLISVRRKGEVVETRKLIVGN